MPLSTRPLSSNPSVADSANGADESAHSTRNHTQLSALEIEVIEVFVSLVRILGIPKSVAEIYGLLFVSATPLALDAIMERLQISKGSVSQGLKLLRSLGAVKPAYVGGDRRDHYIAETELKKLVAGFIRGEVQPKIESGEARLSRLQSLVLESKGDESLTSFYQTRVGKLSQWHHRSREFLPLLSGMLDESP
jgi:HTH-type transcriptional regulator, glycine betaine synthesis regulator